MCIDKGQFVEMDLNFSVLQRFRLRGDLEGVTIHPVTGSLFLVAENRATVYEYDVIARRVLRTIRIDIRSHDDFADGLIPNRGIEGIAIVETSDNKYQLFAVVESDPPRLISLSADVSSETTAHARARVAEDSSLDPIRQEARIIASYDLGLRRLSDVCDDPQFLRYLLHHGRTEVGVLAKEFKLDASKVRLVMSELNNAGLVSIERGSGTLGYFQIKPEFVDVLKNLLSNSL